MSLENGFYLKVYEDSANTNPYYFLLLKSFLNKNKRKLPPTTPTYIYSGINSDKSIKGTCYLKTLDIFYIENHCDIRNGIMDILNKKIEDGNGHYEISIDELNLIISYLKRFNTRVWLQDLTLEEWCKEIKSFKKQISCLISAKKLLIKNDKVRLYFYNKQ